MLLNCPECELQVSDKAKTCPHCGYPMQEEIKISRSKKSNKRKRLPNGFGQISEIKGQNLRNPFRVMVTVGKDKNGKPICKLLKPKSYFPTYNEAYAALIDHHRKPYNIGEDIVMQDLFDQWLEKYSNSKKSNNSIKSAVSAWGYCSDIHNMKVKDVRIPHLKDCIENGIKVINGEVRHPSENVAARIKSVFNQMYDYAIEYEYVEKNYARLFEIETRSTVGIRTDKKHMPFTDEEMNKLWSAIGKIDYVELLLIQCYSGWRPSEMCKMKRENVNLEERYFISGSKTEAGQERKVPIHSRIYPFVEKYYNMSAKYNSENMFLRPNGKVMNYNHYRSIMSRIIRDLSLNINHKPHDTRIHFVSQAKKYSVNEYAIKYIVGHRIEDLTERVYTYRDFNWLLAEIEKIK